MVNTVNGLAKPNQVYDTTATQSPIWKSRCTVYLIELYISFSGRDNVMILLKITMQDLAPFACY